MARRNHNSRRRESTPGWVWMLFGLGLGLIVAIGVYLARARRADTRASPSSAVAVVQPATARAAPTVVGASRGRRRGARSAR